MPRVAPLSSSFSSASSVSSASTAALVLDSGAELEVEPDSVAEGVSVSFAPASWDEVAASQ